MFGKGQVYRTPVSDLVDLLERIYTTVYNITTQMQHTVMHGSKFNTSWTFPLPLMEAMLRFMEHKDKIKSKFSLFVAIGFMYRFVLVQKL